MTTMTSRTFAALFSMALLIGLTACGTTSTAESGEPAPPEQQVDEHAEHHPEDQEAETSEPDRQQMMAQMCPMHVEGTTRELVRLDDAVAMEFTTTGDVDELRQRVEKMGQRHGQMHGEGGQMRGEGGQRRHGQMHGEMTEEQRQMRQQMREIMSEVTVETEEIEDGMRVKFTPEDAEDLDELYENMQQHIEMMEEQGHCPMMQMMEQHE